MIYFESTQASGEGFNTHVMRYTMCISLSNFLGRPYYFNSEKPSSTPPNFAVSGYGKDKFGVLLESPRSTVTALLEIAGDSLSDVDLDVEEKYPITMLGSFVFTTEELRRKFENTILLDSFLAGRHALTREQLLENQLIVIGHQTLTSPAYAYFLPRIEKRLLLDSVKIRYTSEIERFADRLTAQLGKYYSAHFRMGDFLTLYSQEEYSINSHRFRQFIRANFPDRDLPVAVATDGLQEKELLSSLFEGYRVVFVDEWIFDEFSKDFCALPYSDFNVLTILDQLICAAGEVFIGTYRSTFTGIIHRLRQERYKKRDFNFFPDNRVAKLLTEDWKIAADQSGFFDWNRYSVFSENHKMLSWAREWDHELSTFDL
jgi:hypothetical protein